jgi:hypothetical protein
MSLLFRKCICRRLLWFLSLFNDYNKLHITNKNTIVSHDSFIYKGNFYHICTQYQVWYFQQQLHIKFPFPLHGQRRLLCTLNQKLLHPSTLLVHYYTRYNTTKRRYDDTNETNETTTRRNDDTTIRRYDTTIRYNDNTIIRYDNIIRRYDNIIRRYDTYNGNIIQYNTIHTIR